MSGDLAFIENRDSIVPSSQDYEPVPKGTYRQQIITSEVKPTSTGGMMLKVEIENLDPKYAGRRAWHNFNIQNNSEKAQQIGLGQLSALAKACGKQGIPEESSSLWAIPHLGKWEIEESPGYKAKNVIKGFYPLDARVNGASERNKPLVAETNDLESLPDFMK